MGSFGLVHWLIVAAIAYGLYRVLRPSGSSGTQAHCMTCGSDAVPRRRTKGSFAIEIVLWICFIVPGLIYSIWRLTTRQDVCAVCGAENIVPLGSPAAVSHRQQLGTAASPPRA